MENLYNALRSGNRETVLTAITKARDDAAEMLEKGFYSKFCEHLREELKSQETETDTFC
jgi:hypothetical protein